MARKKKLRKLFGKIKRGARKLTKSKIGGLAKGLIKSAIPGGALISKALGGAMNVAEDIIKDGMKKKKNRFANSVQTTNYQVGGGEVEEKSSVIERVKNIDKKTIIYASSGVGLLTALVVLIKKLRG